MADADYARVVSEGGLRGTILGPSDTGDDDVAIVLDDGREISAPASSLTRRNDGAWLIDTNRAGLGALEERHVDRSDSETVIPVVSEELDIDRRKTPVSTVRVAKHVTERQEEVSMPLTRERVDVRRVLVDRPVDGPLPVRREGDTLILPVVEEIAVVQKRLVLKEEIHATRRRSTEQHEQTVTLRSEHAEVDRVDTANRQLPLNVTEQRAEQPGPRSLLDPNRPAPAILAPESRPKRRRVRENKIIKED
jgi:uncharacterized protein (TIGR02271 family)